MDRQQYELARAIIEVDCGRIGGLFGEDGTTCAVGGLMRAINPDVNYHDILTAYNEMCTVFGISPDQASSLATANDAGSKLETQERRVARVVLKLDTFPIEGEESC